MRDIFPGIFVVSLTLLAIYAIGTFHRDPKPVPRTNFGPAFIAHPTIPIISKETPTPEYTIAHIVMDTPTPQAIYQQIQETTTYEVVYIAPTDVYETSTLNTSTETPTITTYNTLPVIQVISPTIQVVEQEYLLSYTLDEMWDQVVAAGLDNRVPDCSYPLDPPLVNWEMAYQAAGIQTNDRTYTQIKMEAQMISNIVAQGGGYFPSDGIVQIQEETIKNKMIEMYINKRIYVCKDENKKPTLYGMGVQEFLDWVAIFRS